MFKQEINDLRATIDSLKDEVTEINKKIDQSSKILTTMGMADTNLPWWKDERILYAADTDSDTRLLAYNIESGQKRDYARKHPSLKQKAVYHGGCLGCKRPETEGLGGCKGCQYFEGNWSCPNKFME